MRDPRDKSPNWPTASGINEPFGGEPVAAPYYAPAKRNKEQLREVLDLLYRGKWIILGVFVLVVSIVAAYTYTLSPIYEAYSLVFVETRQSSDLSEMLDQSRVQSTPFSDRTLANEMVVLQQSLPIAMAVADSLMVMRTLPGTDIPLSILQTQEGEMLSHMGVASRLQGRYVRVLPEGRGIDFVRIVGTSTFPQEAALLANLFADAFVRRTRESSRARISASRLFLEEQETRQYEELRRLEAEIEAYMSREGAVALDQEAQQTVAQISLLEAQRDEARIDLQMRSASLRSLERELEQIQPRLAERIASGVEREIEATQQQIAELEVRVEQIYLRNPALRDRPAASGDLSDLNAQIAQLESKVDALSQQYVDEVMAVGGMNLGADDGSGFAQVAQYKRQLVEERIAISGLEAKSEVLDRRLTAYSSKLKDIPAQAIQLAQLQRARQSAERMYLFMVEKLQEARVAEESELGYAEIIRQALVPGSPVRPNKMRNLQLGVLLGLVLGISLALLRQQLDKRLYKPEDLREMGLSVLGVIPKMDHLIKEDFAGQTTVEMEGRHISTTLLALLSPLSPIVETYRQIRTHIQFSRPDTIVQTMLVTSSGAGEGKTVTASNLAVVMAQSGRRTLIIDADLRRPRLHNVLGLPREPGLVELLFEKVPLEIDRYATGIDDLYAITAGTAVHNPAELLGSRKMRDLIGQLREHFDVVIFDTPPVMIATDAVLLATQCDATVVVAAAGQTEEHDLEQCMDSLRSVGAVVIGNLLNGFDASMAQGYKYKYYRYSRYGYGRKYQSYYRAT